ncbi:MAG: hypothetical protein AAGE76_16435 [Pseudomonadota bacterium]
MTLMRAILAIAALALLAACAVEKGGKAHEIEAVRHVSDTPPSIAIVSMVNRNNGRAAHTALIVNGSERVIYDPAGTFEYDAMVERGDVHYGATDRAVEYFERYHARFAYFVHVQEFRVSAEVAELALQRTRAQGPAPQAFCTMHTTAILKDLPGFERLGRTFFPESLRKQAARLPGVIDRYRIEEDREKAIPAG